MTESTRIRRTVAAVAALGLCAALSSGASAGFFGRSKKKEKVDAFAAAHEPKAKEYAAKETAHDPVKKGSCSKCHADPADPSKLLQENKPLCLSCHTERAEDLKKPTVHYAFAEMGCDACHVPHASEQPFLLSAPVNELCGNCHDTTDDAIKKAHAGISVFEGNCTACHNPHASKKAKLILEADEHIPFGSRSCEMCHKETGANGKPALKELPDDSCFVCHSNFRKLDESPVTHMPAVSGGCTSCHNPHISKRSSLIRGPMDSICFGCHETWLKNNHPTTRHPTTKDGVDDPRRAGKPFNCASCHQPHAGKLPKLLRGDINVLCKECHQK